MIRDHPGLVVGLWCYGYGNERNDVQNGNRLLVAGGNHRVTRSHFGLAAGVRLRHVSRAAHLGHMFAAVVLLDRHGTLRHHACQKGSGRPVEGEERKRHGGRTTHVVSVWLTCRESK